MDIPNCGHKSRSCIDGARQYVRSITGRGVTYYIPLRDLED
jgi:hypothetical protein